MSSRAVPFYLPRAEYQINDPAIFRIPPGDIAKEVLVVRRVLGNHCLLINLKLVVEIAPNNLDPRPLGYTHSFCAGGSTFSLPGCSRCGIWKIGRTVERLLPPLDSCSGACVSAGGWLALGVDATPPEPSLDVATAPVPPGPTPGVSGVAAAAAEAAEGSFIVR